jgi:hypothetical protein
MMFGLALITTSAMAETMATATEEAPITSKASYLDLKVEARADWQWTQDDGHTDRSNTGFEGKFLSLSINGTIVDGFTYSWRQRFNKYSKDSNFFDATDWIYLDYRYKDCSFRAGKDVVAIGGWEYDANPINIYRASVFWNNIGCYQWGVSAGLYASMRDKVTFQITQSPFFTTGNRNMYAYNIMWSGTHGIYKGQHSINLMEYDKGRYISYIALGNEFNIDHVTIDLDLMNRASSHQAFLFKDVSVMAEVGWNFNPRWCVKGKYTYDVNKSGNNSDLTVYNGTELSMAGACIEYYPLLKDRTSLRLHAGCWYSWGKDGNAADLMQNKTMFLSAGVTWNMNIFTLKRK